MADFLLQHELPNLKVAVNNTPMENDDGDPMDMDDQKEIPEESPSNRTDSSRRRSTDEATKGNSCRDDEATLESRVEGLYRSLGIDPKRPPATTMLNVVHVRGVTEMSTEEVRDYFGDYSPLSVDWVNDYSCNVVWKEAKGAARALLGLTRPVLVRGAERQEGTPKPKSGKSPMTRPCGDAVAVDGNLGEEVVVMSEDDPSDGEDPRPSTDPGPTEELDISRVDVPVPPGRWRRGVPHAKAAILLLRFSNRHDKKTSGAEKRSEYYKKYGNPNYGGMTGLISGSRKRRMRKGASASSKSDGELDEDEEEDEIQQKEPKRLRMKMYADEEEEKIRKKKIGRRRAKVGTPPTPWSTPGNSPASDEDPPGGSSVWDRLSGGRPAVGSCYDERDESPPLDESREMQPHRGGYVDLDDPRLREDYDPAEDPYDPWADYGGRHRTEWGPVSGGDLRSKLEALRRSRKTSAERVAPLRISVLNDAD